MKTAEIINELNEKGIYLSLTTEKNLLVSAENISLDVQTTEYIKNNKPALVEYLKNQKSQAEEEIKPCGSYDNILASYSQESLWVVCKREDSNQTLYNIPWILRIQGPLNVSILSKSVNKIFKRHDILRSYFKYTKDNVFQVIPEIYTLPIAIHEFSDVSEDEKENELTKKLDTIKNHRFDLEKGPLMYCEIIKLSDNNHVLLSIFHHTIFDGWSVEVYGKELESIYIAISNNEKYDSRLDSTTLQYADYSSWQRRKMRNGVYEEQKKYWKKNLNKLPLKLDFPTDRPRPEVQSYNGKQFIFKWPKALKNKLVNFSRKNNTTLYNVLLAAFNVLMYRYSGQKDIAIGAPFANRGHPGVEGIIGFISNMLVFRNKVDDNYQFEDFLKEVESTAYKAYDNADIPFEQVVKLVNPERSLSFSPLFQIVFILQSVKQDEIHIPGLVLQEINQSTGTSPYDLTLSMFESPEGLKGRVGYNCDLFDRISIDRMMKNFTRLIKELISESNKKISDINYLSKDELHTVINTWNQTDSDRHEKTVNQIFEKQVIQYANNVAVSHEGETLSYEQLNIKAIQLACFLRKHGVGPEVSVGLLLDQSIEMIVAVVAIVKAGGSYVPIDPDYPLKRVEYILDDANINIIISQHKLKNQFPFNNRQVYCLDDSRLFECINGYKQSEESVRDKNPSTHQLLYVNYTSGSTGKPKGVMVTHKNVISLIDDNNTLKISSTDVIAQGSNYAFDAFSFELWGALLNGAKLELVSKQNLIDSSALEKNLSKSGISVLFVTTALFNKLVEHNPNCFGGLNKLLFGGEKYSADMIEKVLTSDAPKNIFHVYGPTEGTTFTTSFKLDYEHFLREKIVPIGKPLANRKTYILDEKYNPVPILSLGELFIGGEGVARGYLNNTSLSQEKFISNPFSCNSKEKLYRSGDLVRWLSDGNIEFIGRKDDQVKIRGFRIELGEIEQCICRHENIKSSVVLVIDSFDRGKKIVAYLVLNAKEIDNEESRTNILSELKHVLAEHLPNFMLPNKFLFVDEIPLNENGKVNKDALRNLSSDISEPTEAIESCSLEEKQLCEIWMKVLEIESLSIKDDFFELGGDSLLVTTIINEIRDVFEKEISIRDFYKATTVESLSKLIVEKDKKISIPKFIAEESRDESLALHTGEEEN